MRWMHKKNHRKTFIGWKEEVSLSSISLKSNYQGRNEVCGIHNDPSFYPYFVIHDPKISDNFDPWSRKTKLIPSKNWKKLILSLTYRSLVAGHVREAYAMCWPWPFIWKIFLKNTILFFFTFLPLSLCSSGDHNVIFDEKEYSPLPPPPPPKKRIKWPHTWTRLLHMDFSITWNNGRSELVILHATKRAHEENSSLHVMKSNFQYSCLFR